MCGILGMFSYSGPPPHRELWPSLVNHLYHRGPDGGGWWADDCFFLGHRRLSIIDLDTGGQPMATADGRFVVTFNGEIYNYRALREELRREGATFRTHSDTEVLLQGYRYWGTSLPQKLTGMFAFAIADREKKEIFLARDRFGEKPLFILQQPDYIAFASEIRPLAALPDLQRSIDTEALCGYLCLNYAPGDQSLLKGVRRLSPATWKRYAFDRSSREEHYWCPPRQSDIASRHELLAALEEGQPLLDAAVKRCMESDVPVGIFLSGGIDSSLIAESAARQGQLSRAYCIDFAEASYSESAAAQQVAASLGIPFEKIVLTTDVLKTFPEIIEHADDPLADSSCLPVWVISQYASRHNKVVLGGDGGDELNGGYLTYLASMIHASVTSHWPLYIRRCLADWMSRMPTDEAKVSFLYKLRRFFRALHLPLKEAHASWNGTWLPEDIPAFVPQLDPHAAGRYLSHRDDWPSAEPPGSFLYQCQRWDLGDYLPNDILTKTDRMGMAHGLEIRAPFLDYTFAEWLLKKPDTFKANLRGKTKIFLRQLAARKHGTLIANRPKQGFSIPVHAWMRNPMRDIIIDYLSEESLKKIPILNASRIRQVMDEHFSGKRSWGFELWGLVVLAAWHKARIEIPIPLPNKTLPEQLHFDYHREGSNA